MKWSYGLDRPDSRYCIQEVTYQQQSHPAPEDLYEIVLYIQPGEKGLLQLTN